MTQANDGPSDAETPDAVIDSSSTGASLGQQLRAAREQRGLSLEQVSDALHLDEPIIAALEQDDFATLGAPVYVRGHLKTYAQLLGLSPEVILSEYQSPAAEPVVAPALRQPSRVSISVNPILWAGGALAILLGLMLGFYVLLNDETDTGPGAVADASADRSTAASGELAVSVVAVTETVNKVPRREESRPEIPRVVSVPPIAPEEPIPVVSTEVEAEDFTPGPRPAATMRLELAFSEESWVEISDANRRLLFGLQHEGNRREVVGEPPFNLLIGNALGVKLMVNDQPYEVPAAGLRGKVARFEITGAEQGEAE